MDLDAGQLCAALFVSSIGGGLVVYGKKNARLPHLAVGILLCCYPAFVASALLQLLLFACLMLALRVATRAGW